MPKAAFSQGKLRVIAAAGALATVLMLDAGSLACAASLKLLDLQVFAKETIEGTRSDYQGPTAAGGSIDLQDFDIDGDLTAGGVVRFRRGQVHGAIRSPETRLDKVFASGTSPSRGRDLGHLSAQLDDLASRLACLPATISPVITRGELLGQPLSTIRLTASGGLDVADLSAADLASSGPNQHRLVLTGSPGSRLVVRVHGTEASLRDLGFALKGLTPGQVVFAFPEAERLTIASSGGAYGADGTEWGVPGSIVAPQSSAQLAAATITGQVFVRSIAGIPGLPSGQVNRLDAQADRADFTSSAVLRHIGGDLPLPCGSDDR